MSIFKYRKTIAWFLLVLMILQTGIPANVYALTSGPSQPEMQTFKQAGSENMVDLFTGDFSYSIPLFELPGPNGGYPFVLHYQGGVTMDQEASWVGLGWNLSAGAITRHVRGVPDDFKGGDDQVVTEIDMRPNFTVGVGGGVGLEALGLPAELGSVGLSIFRNNYKGVGYNIDASFGYKAGLGNSSNVKLGLDISLNSQEGVDLRPSLDITSNLKNLTLSEGIGLGFNSVRGLYESSVGFGVNGYTSNFSFGKTAFMPNISYPTISENYSAKVKPGGAFAAIFPEGYVIGYFNKQSFQDRKTPVSRGAYGYLYEAYAGEEDVIDVNRENDGPVSQETPNLPVPVHTCDMFSVNAHGLSGSFRPYRNDVGVLYDHQSKSESVAGALGADIAPGLAHVGTNLTIMKTSSVAKKWSDYNRVTDRFDFKEKQTDKPYEPWYFASENDNRYMDAQQFQNLNGEGPIQVQTRRDNDDNAVAGNFSAQIPDYENLPRQPRSQVLIPFTNEQLLSEENDEILSLFNVDGLDRSSRPGNHLAGFMAIAPNGVRYIFALPVYNEKQEEYSFSVGTDRPASLDNYFDSFAGDDIPYKGDGTDQFFSKRSLSPYAYAYLLTAVVGPDYIDVSQNGVDEEDLGYWCKFSYDRHASAYRWRNPYQGIVYNAGYLSDPEDNKGSFIYGEKEIYYLRQVETKSHIARFTTTTEVRDDGLGAPHLFKKSGTKGTLKSLEEAALYTRAGFAAGRAERKVRFAYDNSLCTGVPNSSSGKLKLASLELIDGQRSGLKPYEFTYDNNPSFQRYQRDPWGFYYDHQNEQDQEDFPYIDQSRSKDDIDALADAWSLTEIELPSGSKIHIDYESDDYAYVQHKPAMQFFRIVDAEMNENDASDPVVEFEMEEKSIPTEVANDAALAKQYIREKYIGDNEYVYFKSKVNLKENGDGLFDWVNGYAEFHNDPFSGISNPIVPHMGPDGQTTVGYRGKVRLKALKGYHPIRALAWQHLRVNQPELIHGDSKPEFNVDWMINSLLNLVSEIKAIFTGFNEHADTQGWASEIASNGEKAEAWIRLQSPDGVKYGGGARVKEVRYTDNWAHGESSYGQVYNYRMEDGTSSGVATFEPGVGGEENPLRQPKVYDYSYALRSKNSLYFEYPINESYYPGPQVGYRRVEVMSLASAEKSGTDISEVIFPDDKSFGSTGKTVHEFYTAKDFPVMTNETDKTDKTVKFKIGIPGLGAIEVDRLTSSQGYSVVTNDMHGKPKKVSNFRQAEDGTFETQPFSWVAYRYKSSPVYYQGERVNKLDNYFTDLGPVVSDDGADDLLMGTTHEIFTDMRENFTRSTSGGLNVNVDLIFLFFVTIPIVTAWGNLSNGETELNTVVANKVVRQRGFLLETEAYTEGSKVTTRNVKWDKLTGAPVVSRVNNMYEDAENEYIYDFNALAYHHYPNIGPAYLSAGLELTLHLTLPSDRPNEYHAFVQKSARDLLTPGDELIIYNMQGQAEGTATYLGGVLGNETFYSETDLQSILPWKAMVYRPGARNMLDVSVGSVKALTDPSAGAY